MITMQSSILLRALADARCLPAPDTPSADFEGPSRWLSLPQAVGLHGVLARLGALRSVRLPQASQYPSAQPWLTQLQQVRADLLRRIDAQLGATPDPAQQPALAPTLRGGRGAARADEAYRHVYRVCQRDIDQTLTPLRTALRDALAQAGSGPARVAALDAALDEALGDAALPRLMGLADCAQAGADHTEASHAERLATLRSVLYAELGQRLALLHALAQTLPQPEVAHG
ncbi:MAG: hypothetical protein Fur007_02250 [Rhodoferax sp.]